MTHPFEDRFAYAVSVAQLRDGLQGTIDELRAASETAELERVLTNGSKQVLLHELKQRFGWSITVEQYNDMWAEMYLAQVGDGR